MSKPHKEPESKTIRVETGEKVALSTEAVWARNEARYLAHEERMTEVSSPIGLGFSERRSNQLIEVRVNHLDKRAGDWISGVGVDNLNRQLEIAFAIRHRRCSESHRGEDPRGGKTGGRVPHRFTRHGTKRKHGPASFRSLDGESLSAISETVEEMRRGAGASKTSKRRTNEWRCFCSPSCCPRSHRRATELLGRR